MKTVTIAVPPATAESMTETQRIALERLVSPLVDPSFAAHDPLASVLLDIALSAHIAGLTEKDIDAELAAYTMERRR